MSGNSGGPSKNDLLHLPLSSLRIVAVLCSASLLVLVAYLVGLWLFVFGVLRPAILCGLIAASLAGLYVLPWRPILRGLRRRFRFRLATLLLVVPVLGLVAGLFGKHLLERHRERRAYSLVSSVLADHDHVLICQSDGDPYKSRQLWDLPNPCLRFVGQRLTDDEMRKLSGMKNLAMLVFENTKVTEHGLMELEKVRDLTVLVVDTPDVSDESLERVKRSLPACRVVRSYADLAAP